MHSLRIVGLAVVMAATMFPFAAHAGPDQRGNRGYMVGAGGVARSAEAPQPEGNEPAASPSKQSQGVDFGERASAGPRKNSNPRRPAKASRAKPAAPPKLRGLNDEQRGMITIIR